MLSLLRRSLDAWAARRLSRRATEPQPEKPSLDMIVAATRSANSAWAAKRRAQLSDARVARIKTIIETGVRP